MKKTITLKKEIVIEKREVMVLNESIALKNKYLAFFPIILSKGSILIESEEIRLVRRKLTNWELMEDSSCKEFLKDINPNNDEFEDWDCPPKIFNRLKEIAIANNEEVVINPKSNLIN